VPKLRNFDFVRRKSNQVEGLATVVGSLDYDMLLGIPGRTFSLF
jgi:hypothetical protein